MGADTYFAGGVSAPPPREAADALEGYATPLNPAAHAPHGSYAAPTVAGVVAPEDTLEARAAVLYGIEPLDALQARRAALVQRASRLRAQRDVFDARRKERRNAIAALIRAEHPGRKFGVQEMEDVASGDARYKAFLDESELAFAQLAVLEDEIQAVTERVNRGQALLRLAHVERYAT